MVNNFKECRVSSHKIMSDFFKTFIALKVISSRFPIGVETIYKLFVGNIIIMKKIIIITISYILIFFNFNLLSKEANKTLKVGLIAPLTGEYEELGNSLLYSLQLALDEINDDKVFIIPRDSGFNDKDKLKWLF